jgi:hypothetical protein
MWIISVCNCCNEIILYKLIINTNNSSHSNTWEAYSSSLFINLSCIKIKITPYQHDNASHFLGCLLPCFPCSKIFYYCLLTLCVGCISCCGGYPIFLFSFNHIVVFASMELCFWFGIAYDGRPPSTGSYEVRLPIPSSLFIGFVFFLPTSNTAKFSLLISLGKMEKMGNSVIQQYYLNCIGSSKDVVKQSQEEYNHNLWS